MSIDTSALSMGSSLLYEYGNYYSKFKVSTTGGDLFEIYISK